jgi:hypothetical protein
MRRFLFVLTLLGAATALCTETNPRPATAEEVALLKAAMKNTDQDTEHWAYTETTTVRDKKNRVRNGTVVRFDPSKPYAEQFAPVTMDGKPPTEKQLKKYRQQGEKRGEKRARDAAKPKTEGEPPEMTINSSKASVDVDHPLVVQDEADRITFEIPLRAKENKDIPVEKLQILVQVGKPARQVERAVFRIRESFRMKLVAKIKTGEASVDFTVVDPAFGPVMTTMTGNIGASVLLIPLNATFTNTRTDWRRVKAYDERFSVKLAPLQILGF